MLVLTRRIGEELVIGQDIRITIVDIDKRRVRIGVAAPKSIPVHRVEIHNRRLKNPKLNMPSARQNEMVPCSTK